MTPDEVARKLGWPVDRVRGFVAAGKLDFPITPEQLADFMEMHYCACPTGKCDEPRLSTGDWP